MRIGIDSNCIEGENRTGLYTYLTDIIKNLPTIAPENKYNLYFKKKIPSNEFIKNSSFKLKLLQKPPAFFWTKKPLWNTYCLPKELLFNKMDVFYSPFYALPVFWSPIKSVLGIHDVSYEAHPEWFPPEWLKTIRHKSRVSAEKSNAIITNSEFCKSEIIKYYRVDEKKVFVVYPGISKHFRHDSSLDENFISEKYNINRPFILSVGALYPRRNTIGLIKAFKQIANKIKDHQLVIIGHDQNYGQENIPKLISETNQELGSERIIHKQFVPDEILEYLFKKAELFASLTNYEGFGSYSMLEAMIYGCPVVAVKTSSMPELIGDTGIYTSHDNIQKIGDTIYNVLKDKKLRKKISAAAGIRIKKFSTENMTKQFIDACNYAYNN